MKKIKSKNSTWPFSEPEPPWYTDQTKRWKKLGRQGWKFAQGNSPVDSLSTGDVSIEMARDGMVAEFKLSKLWSFQEIHTWMLHRCEEFAKANRWV